MLPIDEFGGEPENFITDWGSMHAGVVSTRFMSDLINKVHRDRYMSDTQQQFCLKPTVRYAS